MPLGVQVPEGEQPGVRCGACGCTPGGLSRAVRRWLLRAWPHKAAAGAGAAAGLRPLYCNAACFAFKKSLYESLDDPLQRGLTSGDDTLFMHSVKRNHNKSIRLLKSPESVVLTRGLSKWSDYINQRRRWISKSRHYKDTATLITAVLVLLVNLCFIGSLTIFIAGWNYWLFPIIYMGKTLTDLLFLTEFTRFYSKKLPVLHFMMYSLIYPFYVAGIAATGFLHGYTWKGRYYKPTGRKND